MSVYSIEEIKEIITPIAKAHDLEKICLFGSYARGEATENSDIDFLVYGFVGKGYIEFSELKEKISDYVNKPVDVIRVENLRLKLKLGNDELIRKFVRKLKEDMVVIYEKS